jgi:hypothetical protein
MKVIEQNQKEKEKQMMEEVASWEKRLQEEKNKFAIAVNNKEK